MILPITKEERWKLFEHFASRLIANHPNFLLARDEYKAFIYLKYYFAEDYARQRLMPWLPSIFNPM